MGWSTTLGAWARREAVLVSCLAAAAAIAALAGPLGVAWLWIAGVIIAAAGALARVMIAARRARKVSASGTWQRTVFASLLPQSARSTRR